MRDIDAGFLGDQITKRSDRGGWNKKCLGVVDIGLSQGHENKIDLAGAFSQRVVPFRQIVCSRRVACGGVSKPIEIICHLEQTVLDDQPREFVTKLLLTLFEADSLCLKPRLLDDELGKSGRPFRRRVWHVLVFRQLLLPLNVFGRQRVGAQSTDYLLMTHLGCRDLLHGSVISSLGLLKRCRQSLVRGGLHIDFVAL